VHRLRVVLGRKGEDLLARDVARAEGAEPAGLEIFESQRGRGLRELREGSPIVAVICSNLNPPAHMAHAPTEAAGFR